MTKVSGASVRQKLTLLFAIATAILLLYGFSAASAYAASVEVGDFTVDRSYNSGNVVTVTKYNGSGGAITLPTKATINDVEYTVTSVGISAFQGNTKITDVTIPEEYTTISASAFKNCTNLQSVSIPGSLTMLGANAFEDCTMLTTVTFAEDTAASLNLMNDIFLNCTALASLELPARLSNANNNFARGCTALTSLTIQGNPQNFSAVDNVLYKIAEDSATLVAYAYGKEETEFTVPENVAGKTVTAIGMHAFRGNGVLQKITLPASVTDLKGFAFEGLTAVQEIVLETTTVPTLGSSVCLNMASGSKITVNNQEIATAFEPQEYAAYYTPENTTVQVAGAVPATVAATFSIAAESAMVGNHVVYHIYLDEANNVNTILLKITLDPQQVSEGTFATANSAFDISSFSWTTEGGDLVLTGYLGTTGNQTGFTTAEKTKLATVSVPLLPGVKGNITASLTKAACAGIPNADENAMDGVVMITGSAGATFQIASCDVNSDGQINIIDITEAQRYYQSSNIDVNWDTAKVMDVNGDNKVDIEDYIAIFNNISNF